MKKTCKQRVGEQSRAIENNEIQDVCCEDDGPADEQTFGREPDADRSCGLPGRRPRRGCGARQAAHRGQGGGRGDGQSDLEGCSRDRHLRYPPASTPLAGTREWWVAVSRSRAVRRAAGSPALPTALVRRGSAAPVLAGRRRGPRSPGLAPPRVPPEVVSMDHGGCASSLVAQPLVGALIGSMIATARRHVLVTVPYVHASAARVAAAPRPDGGRNLARGGVRAPAGLPSRCR